jgi:hypothetical protein
MAMMRDNNFVMLLQLIHAISRMKRPTLGALVFIFVSWGELASKKVQMQLRDELFDDRLSSYTVAKNIERG